MENLSEPVERIAIPLAIPVPAYLRDHHVGGVAVLPAVEALQNLARSKPAAWGADPCRQERALFHRLLEIDPGATEIPALHEHLRYADGRCLSRLTTLRSGGRLKVARRMEHLSVWFMPVGREAAGMEGNTAPDRERRGPSRSGEDFGPEIDFPPVPDDAPAISRKSIPNVIPAKAGIQKDQLVKKDWTPASAGVTTFYEFIPDDPTPIPGPAFTVSDSRLYDELVPFGPAYRNVRGDVFLAEGGVSATVSGGDFPEAEGPLGSPFPLDAAMHAACAWGQRYRNRVVFPIGFDRREILAPTRAGETYLCRIAPLPDEGAVLRFDIRLYGCDGHLRREDDPARLGQGGGVGCAWR
jgi:hypothetical protein